MVVDNADETALSAYLSASRDTRWLTFEEYVSQVRAVEAATWEERSAA